MSSQAQDLQPAAVDKPQRGWSLASLYLLDAPDPAERLKQFASLGGALLIGGGALTLIVSFLPGAPEVFRYERAVGLTGLVATLVGLGLTSFPQLVSPFLMFSILIGAVFLITFGSYAAGADQMAYGAMFYCLNAALAFCGLKRRYATIVLGLIGVCFAVVLLAQQPLATAISAWIFTIGTVYVTGAFVAWLVQYGHRLAVSERTARTLAERSQAELAELNRELESRVQQQVAEVERLARLRGVLSPEVTNAILGSDELLKPHRREIAVFFVDLRGFTSFASEVEPEEVVDLLSQFYATLGRLFARYQATVGMFEGDGVMAFFGDPVSVEAPAANAVETALALRTEMTSVLSPWRERGFELHYGVGIALGYATLGLVGFEGRQEYTAVGTIVNLASRLCDEASPGEILLDKRAATAAPKHVELQPIEAVQLKGFRDPVMGFRVVELGGRAGKLKLVAGDEKTGSGS
ncbi:MAG: adenylate/guanylate cyclase domain-containing protein [Actinomycetota bacterium]